MSYIYEIKHHNNVVERVFLTIAVYRYEDCTLVVRLLTCVLLHMKNNVARVLFVHIGNVQFLVPASSRTSPTSTGVFFWQTRSLYFVVVKT